MARWAARAGIAVAALAALLGGAALFFSLVINPAVMEELRNNPMGEEAREAMLLTFGDRTLPVNYLKEGEVVYIGVDGRWWRAFSGEGAPVSLLIQGQTYRGHAIAADDAALRDDVFARLRPTEPTWLPEWLRGTLVVITLDPV